MWISRLRAGSTATAFTSCSVNQHRVIVACKGSNAFSTSSKRIEIPRAVIFSQGRRNLSWETPAELLIAHPVISYGTTIVLLTLGFRTGITLPMAIWSRNRMKRIKQIVKPEMRRLNDKLAIEVAKESRQKGLGYDEYRKALKLRLAVHQAALHKQYKTHPAATIAAPLLLHIPFFLLLSYTIRTASLSPEFQAEIHPTLLPWLTSIGEADPNGILPITLGIIAFANAELADRRRIKNEEALDIQADFKTKEVEANNPTLPIKFKGPTKAEVERAAATGTPLTVHGTVQPQTRRPGARPLRSPTSQPTLPAGPLLQVEAPANGQIERSRSLAGFLSTGAMRLLAIAFVGIAMQAPAALSLYWLTSVTYSLIQSLAFDKQDAKEEEEAAAATALAVTEDT